MAGSRTVPLTFAECIEIAGEDTPKHLMLGNGFSMALYNSVFNYKQLSDKITDPIRKNLFKQIATNDFELMMRRLRESAEILECYEFPNKICEIVRNEIDELKKDLINIIISLHPQKFTEINKKNYESCKFFLMHFKNGKKFTFNYDLLLYWACLDGLKDLGLDDGFRYSYKNPTGWIEGDLEKQDLYFMHGAVHLFNDDGGIIKCSAKSGFSSIFDQIKSYVNEDKYPTIISEGKSEDKLLKIKNNSYLKRCLNCLEQIEGSLFIFGHSLRDEDEHILEIFNKNLKLNKIFISIYGASEREDNKKIISKVGGWKLLYPEKEYFLYQAESANVWGKQNIFVEKESVQK